MSKILVFGASGQLGTCLRSVAARQGITEITFPVEGSANILNKEGLKALFDLEKPEFVINCAAYTAVDKAEDELKLATDINCEGAKNLAVLCKDYASTLIHISTDFVFEGNIPKLLQEEDIASPISVYGLTKLQGEQAIAAVTGQFYILRTSWLYSEFANNFVKTMLKLGADRDELKVIADQVGTPTYAIDLAEAIFKIIASGNTSYGIYHYSNEGVTSWYDFAKAIFELSNTSVKLLPISTSEYPTKAMRPAFSVMNKQKIKTTFNLDIPHWRDSLEKCIIALNINA
ncbi:NAD(P)-dependent oxidoreductase [Pedobacter quisquiliarum]|uniref:dTDP-4-dehydrorhamnose reductase n=1 Tax=Pedobacter quisquiliarum TaxID=1834438 RepID=A0A916UAC3_9SPHI|nr:dTDP-4-dehydrorhamnose reductase [Pedobacter quisquiliarum]GGC65000.1 NAD(P)-dependent oxidoreductase [Pedobacter quisquiliarum]